MTLDVMQTIEQHESVVRSYIRTFPKPFDKASGVRVYDTDGHSYLDFFAGASVLNYGHNNPELKKPLLEYLQDDRIVHSLDMASVARAEFLETFHRLILEPRGMHYRVQFPGPTGTNAVEAALKIARKVTGRQRMVSFTNAFHGMTVGSLAVTGNAFKRKGAGFPLTYSESMPYCGYFGQDVDTLEYMDKLLADKGSGVDHPAAIITETVQGEGGLAACSMQWLKGLEELCRKHDLLLIVDDIQTGNGRTGPYFSFEEAGITPDIVTVSKSISGYGLPMSLTLVKPEHDIWEPGEHNGTFRGHNLAFVTAKRALELYWSDDTLQRETERKARRIYEALQELIDKYPRAGGEHRGRGMMRGIRFTKDKELASTISEIAFEHGLIIETSGPEDDVLKLLPPLIIEDRDLEEGLAIIERALGEAMQRRGLA
ncbi:MAG: diaminobutyrate--2-oxoglutarate transaminase [Halorhodospira halophila]|uniref:diaminobutyrate--2-oxoglutarate transaminase n=1 Tax=Halorhodospira TaxID=85108 RepID=UPI001EE7A46D|nr:MULTISPECIES: diaminobutyrate--2-oxoglutarate transaminase [Halorhodospira]MCC3749916.1 diaminobutyrate--2-oxoglutarate transaminase [Halorhodospira halophila]MCG5527836.1 diaminobutyrate--2-oxoglutarate transaminase [Halorhodospira halophila]MCG5533969.1 diaminobutyrate--2-oxoglutarate transaminase [Halorhodospira sp. 9621]MCG5536993.1 diaminobutyrate--2-oxoglutarate transaminase [Halorhodospira sp. 9622]MCG5539723.1 diaminobutyrate--2-oxoglutarate transaminase [Halorhodospira sp. M39old]